MTTPPNSQARLNDFEVPHRIKKNESISEIAAYYQRMGWNIPSLDKGTDAIWRMNTKVYKNLRDRENPDMIFADDVLVIPRSFNGYMRLDKKLVEIYEKVNADKGAKKSLQKIQKDADKFGEQIDFAADILTLFVSVGFKAARLTKASGTVANSSKTFLGKAISEQESIAIDLVDNFYKFIEKQLVNAAPISDSAKKAHGTARSIHGTHGKATEAVKAFVKSASKMKKVGIAVFGAADILLSYTSPSQLAKMYTGFDKTMKEQNLASDKMKREVLNSIFNKIVKRRDEREIVWKK